VLSDDAREEILMHPFHPSETVTIRMAASADAEALRRLAQLDSAPTPGPAPMLIAEVAGELRAAVPLYGGTAIADPFHRTVELVALLTERTRQIVPPRHPPARRLRRPARVRRSAIAFRA
jgi:hypothetical protein